MPCTPRSGRAFGCWKERPVSGPIWLNWPFAGVMVIFALYHGVRLVTAGQRGRPNGYDIDLAHLLMCTAMAAMLVMTFGAHLATAWAVVVGTEGHDEHRGHRCTHQQMRQVDVVPVGSSALTSRYEPDAMVEREDDQNAREGPVQPYGSRHGPLLPTAEGPARSRCARHVDVVARRPP